MSGEDPDNLMWLIDIHHRIPGKELLVQSNLVKQLAKLVKVRYVEDITSADRVGKISPPLSVKSTLPLSPCFQVWGRSSRCSFLKDKKLVAQGWQLQAGTLLNNIQEPQLIAPLRL